MSSSYVEVVTMIERLHRNFLEVVKLELDSAGVRDINNVQALMLFNIGNAKMCLSALATQGCYLGSNVSYNVKKLVETGYLAQERSPDDRRSTLVWLSAKGHAVRVRLSEMLRRHMNMLPQASVERAGLEGAVATLRLIEEFWAGASRSAERPEQFAA